MLPKTVQLRWFRFSLATLILLLTVSCVWLAFQANAARSQKRAVAAIKGMGGSIRYDWELDEDGKRRPKQSRKPNGPKWLRRLIGDEYFQSVVRVLFFEKTLTEEGMSAFKDMSSVELLEISDCQVAGPVFSDFGNLTKLRRIYVYETPITDHDIKHLRDLKSLRELVLLNTAVSDAGLVYLHGLPLSELSVRGDEIAESAVQAVNASMARPQRKDVVAELERLSAKFTVEDGDITFVSVSTITDIDFMHFQELKKLKTLWLSSTQVSDAGIAHLAHLTQLEGLSSSGALATDAWLHHLERLVNLRNLNLHNTAITDAGLSSLRSLTKLEQLTINSGNITDDGIEHLLNLPRLEELSLRYSKLTSAGLARLQQLKNLRQLDLSFTGVPDDIVQDLQTTMPNINIKRIEVDWAARHRR